jgi:hypothetical protein
VSYSIQNEQVADREFRSLEIIDDNYDKYVITMDNLSLQGRKGIQWINIIDFLENNES